LNVIDVKGGLIIGIIRKKTDRDHVAIPARYARQIFLIAVFDA
jgi:hypothetical protein